MATPDQWLAKLAKLHVYRTKGGPAPHKPLLLLVVLELAEQGLLGKELALTPELAFRFYSYWKIVAHRRTQKPDIRLPFYHLKSDGFWSVFDGDCKPATSDRDAAYAMLVTDFLAFAQNPIAREKVRRILIATYFQPGERVALYTLVACRCRAISRLPRTPAIGHRRKPASRAVRAVFASRWWPLTSTPAP
jgi:putative restriction endonuclease